jgi:hypothetical protein
MTQSLISITMAHTMIKTCCKLLPCPLLSMAGVEVVHPQQHADALGSAPSPGGGGGGGGTSMDAEAPHFEQCMMAVFPLASASSSRGANAPRKA